MADYSTEQATHFRKGLYWTDGMILPCMIPQKAPKPSCRWISGQHVRLLKIYVFWRESAGHMLR